MISGHQIRNGRALLEWSVFDLAKRAGIDAQMVSRAEIYEGMPFVTVAQAGAIQSAFEAAGVEFIPKNDVGAGVRLRKPGA